MNKLRKNQYINKRCFIVATGPSIAKKDLSFLKNEFVISLNLCPLTLDLHNIIPEINITADKLQYPRYKEIFKELTFKKSIKKIIVASACETFPEELKDKNTFFFPKKLQQETPDFSKNPIKDGFCRGKTVAFDAIQLAFYLGFKEVYILGMDFGKKYVWGKNGHSYEIEKNPKFKYVKFATFRDRMINRGLPGHPEYWEYIKNCMKEAKKAFDEEGRIILNDVNSELDIFDRVDIFKKFGGKNGGVVEAIINGKTGYLIKEGDKKELIKKVLYLYENQKEIERLGKNGRKRIEQEFYKNENKSFVNYLNRIKKDSK